MRIYFDHNATTPVDPVVADAVARALREDFGNPSSVHAFGQRAKTALDDARLATATLIGGEPSEIVFTSGGTESDNAAIRGAAGSAGSDGPPTSRHHRDRARGGAQLFQGARAARVEHDTDHGRPERYPFA